MIPRILISMLLLFVLAATPVLGQGTVVDDTFYSEALGVDRDMRVYLPEGYDPDEMIPYPVIYFLHGANSYSSDPSYLFLYDILDELIGHDDPEQAIQPLVMIVPDGSIPPYAGSMWADSDLYGPFEQYVVNDVIGHAESAYNVRTDKFGRAIDGYSMGGMGGMSIAMAHPTLFCAVASNSGGLDFRPFETDFFPHLLPESGGSAPYEFSPANGILSYLTYTAAGGYSPNMMNPPYYVDFPLDTNGDMVQETFDRWMEHSPGVRVVDVTPGEIGIFFCCGTNDELHLYTMNTGFAQILTDLGHPFTFESDDGTHGGAELLTRITRSIQFVNGYFEYIVPIEDPSEPDQVPELATTALRSAPNPFNPVTHLKFSLDRPQMVTLGIYDLTGRRVTELLAGATEAGEHSHVWRGTADDGQQVPSGTYLARLATEQRISTLKLQLVR